MGYYIELFSCNIVIPRENAQELINDILEFEEEFPYKKIYNHETKETRDVLSWHVQNIIENPSDDSMDLKEILNNHDWEIILTKNGYEFRHWNWGDGDSKLDGDYLGSFLKLLTPHVDQSKKQHVIFVGEDGKLLGAVYNQGYCKLTNL